MLIFPNLHVHLLLIFEQVSLVIIICFAPACRRFRVSVVIVWFAGLLCLRVLAHVLFLRSLIEVDPVDEISCLVTNL